KVEIRDVFGLLYDSDELLPAREIEDYCPRSLQKKNIHVVVSLPTPTDSYPRYFKASQEVRVRAKKTS
ncbi:697_t:CDS:2, partial [Ambispora gerdemannii]